MKHAALTALSLSLLAGCAAPRGGPRTATALEVTSADARGREQVEAVLVVPRPARTLARLQGLVRGSPKGASVLAAAARTASVFDLDQPIQSVHRGGIDVASFGVTRDTAAKVRVTQGEQGPCGVTADAASPRMYCVSKGGKLTREARALGSLAPATAQGDAHLEASRAWFARHAGSAGAVPAAASLLRDVAGMSIDVSLDGAAEARLAVSLDGEDPMTAAMLDAPVAPPPGVFFRLPADAELALFAHAPAAADIVGLRGRLLDEVTHVFAAGATPAEIAQARAHLEPLLFTGGSVALALGFDRRGAEAAVARAEQDEGKLGQVSASHRPWVVVGLEEPAARWVENVAWLMSHDRGAPQGVKITKPGARLGLPAAAVEIASRGKGGSVTLVVPDGASRTWIAIADDEATAAARARASVRGAEDATLAGRPGLASLRGAATFGGFVTAAGAAWIAGHDDDARLMDAALASRSLRTAGRTPIPFKGSVVRGDGAGAGGGGTVSVRVALDAAAIADLFAMLSPAFDG